MTPPPPPEPGTETDHTPVPPPREEIVELANGIRLAVRRWEAASAEGDRPAPWLLVHGLASNARLWDGVARRLAAAGHEVAAVDQRRHGRSAGLDDGPLDLDTPTVADDLALLLDALGWPRAAIAGQSWGGNVVVEFARRHPDRPIVVVGVDGGTIRLAEQFPIWEDCRANLAPPDFTGRTIEEIQGWLASMAADWPEEGRQGTLANFRVGEDGSVSPWLGREDHLRVLHGLWSHDPFDAFRHIEVPTLLIGASAEPPSERDRRREATFDEAVRLLAEGSALWFRPAHHDVHAQHPGPVSDVMLALLPAPT